MTTFARRTDVYALSERTQAWLRSPQASALAAGQGLDLLSSAYDETVEREAALHLRRLDQRRTTSPLTEQSRERLGRLIADPVQQVCTVEHCRCPLIHVSDTAAADEPIVCSDDDSVVLFSQVGTSAYAQCREGHRWQDTYSSATGWMEITPV